MIITLTETDNHFDCIAIIKTYLLLLHPYSLIINCTRFESYSAYITPLNILGEYCTKEITIYSVKPTRKSTVNPVKSTRDISVLNISVYHVYLFKIPT